MKNLLHVAVAVTMASLFVVMFWAQVGGVATAFARGKMGTYAVTSSPYLPIKSLQPVY
jgi:hypothetical protein